jgi:hypothetical protein
MKLGLRARFMFVFREKKIRPLLVDFSTKFPTKTIGGSHMGYIEVDCAWWVRQWYLCALCVRARGANILRVYAPEQGDIPTYKNIAKILRITVSSRF